MARYNLKEDLAITIRREMTRLPTTPAQFSTTRDWRITTFLHFFYSFSVSFFFTCIFSRFTLTSRWNYEIFSINLVGASSILKLRNDHSYTEVGDAGPAEIYVIRCNPGGLDLPALGYCSSNYIHETPFTTKY